MSTATTPRVFGYRRIIFRDVEWQTYGYFLRMFADRPAIRLTYDRGRLEIMPKSEQHEFFSRLLCFLIGALTQELHLSLSPGGSTTLRSRQKLRGLEADECFWITHLPRRRRKKGTDARQVLPPDLAVEINISRSSLDRMGIYAALRVPNVWRFDGRSLSFHALASDGAYHQVASSRLFPFLKPKDLLRFLKGISMDDDINALLSDFRAWVRQKIS